MLERNALKNAVVVFNSEVIGSELMESIPNDFDGDIVVLGDITVDVMHFSINGNLWVDGTIWGMASKISVNGNLICNNIIADIIDVTGYMEAKICGAEAVTVLNDCSFEDLKVDTAIVKGSILNSNTIRGYSLEVGNDIVAEEIYFYYVNVGRDVLCRALFSDGEVVIGRTIVVTFNLQVEEITVESDIIIHSGIIKCGIIKCLATIRSDTEINARKIEAESLYGNYIKAISINTCKLKAVTIDVVNISASDYIFANEIKAHDIYTKHLICENVSCHKMLS